MRREVLLVGEMVDVVQQILQLTNGRAEDDFDRDRVLRDALLWNFTVLGEAAGQLSDEFQADHPEVPWRQPARLRNRIVHGYWSIDIGVLLSTASVQLPAFLAQLLDVQASLENQQG